MLPAEECPWAEGGSDTGLGVLPAGDAVEGPPWLDPPLVLVVEDDNIVRMAAVGILRDAGYATVEAISGPLAMVMLETTPDICIVLTDIDMPLGFDGITLAACVHCRWPGIGIVMTSGKVAPVPGDVPSGAVFIRKPYAEADLLGMICGQIERRRSCVTPRSSRTLLV